MKTIKSYTNIPQSNKLAEILPLESADMYYFDDNGGEPNFKVRNGITYYYDSEDCLCCWSLAALLGVLPKSLIYTPNPTLDRYCCKNIMHDLETYADNPVDACYEMIIKLHKLNLL